MAMDWWWLGGCQDRTDHWLHNTVASFACEVLTVMLHRTARARGMHCSARRKNLLEIIAIHYYRKKFGSQTSSIWKVAAVSQSVRQPVRSIVVVVVVATAVPFCSAVVRKGRALK